jgi:hypothetical protein
MGEGYDVPLCVKRPGESKVGALGKGGGVVARSCSCDECRDGVGGGTEDSKRADGAGLASRPVMTGPSTKG